MERDAEELAWLVSHENGKTYPESVASVAKGIECVEMGVSLPNMVAGGQMDVSRGVNCEVTHEPLGVCAGITPFNFPIMVPLWMPSGSREWKHLCAQAQRAGALFCLEIGSADERSRPA